MRVVQCGALTTVTQMAYGNWGAVVYRNGERVRTHEDATPYREEELEPGYWQAFERSNGANPHHAVLGSKRVRLCGYKYYPVMFVDGAKVDMDKWCIPESDEPWTDRDGVAHHSYHNHKGDIELDGETYSFLSHRGDNACDLWLREPDGTQWSSRCGYGIGAGHEE